MQIRTNLTWDETAARYLSRRRSEFEQIQNIGLRCTAIWDALQGVASLARAADEWRATARRGTVDPYPSRLLPHQINLVRQGLTAMYEQAAEAFRVQREEAEKLRIARAH